MDRPDSFRARRVAGMRVKMTECASLFRPTRLPSGELGAKRPAAQVVPVRGGEGCRGSVSGLLRWRSE